MRYLYAAVQRLIQFCTRFFASQNRVFVFHEIKDDLNCCYDKNCAITKDSFTVMIKKILVNNIILSPEKMLNSNIPSVVLTFDDGYEDIFSFVYPMLKSYNIPFTVFITLDFLDTKGYISQEMLKELCAEPLCTIGSHSISHPMLRFCDDKRSEYEIMTSKTLLEKMICKEVKCFAYPYGSLYACCQRDKEYVNKAGYRMAFSTLNAPIPRQNSRNSFFLPRININENNFFNNY